MVSMATTCERKAIVDSNEMMSVRLTRRVFGRLRKKLRGRTFFLVLAPIQFLLFASLLFCMFTGASATVFLTLFAVACGSVVFPALGYMAWSYLKLRQPLSQFAADEVLHDESIGGIFTRVTFYGKQFVVRDPKFLII